MNQKVPIRKSMDANQLYVLDKDFYPLDKWSDDKIMSAMMYPFRPKQVNLEHFEQKMRFWKEMIENFCDYKGSSNVTISELKEVFKRKGTSPYCLQDVLNQMYNEGNVQEKNSFMEQKQTSWSGWIVNGMYKSASWTMSKIKDKLIGQSTNEETPFIIQSAVQKQARILQEHVRNNHSYNNIISMNDLMANEIDGLSREGVLMALQYLSSYTKTAYIEENKQVYDNDDHHHHKLLIKFSEPHQSVQPITELERSMYNLKNTEHFLTESINKKEQYLNETLAQVKECLKNGKKQMAKTFLRKKLMLENDLSKQMNILDNIQIMIQKIHNSKSDKEILSMYKMGSESIKSVFANNGIDIDNVYDIIENMQEVIEEQDECANALSTKIRRGTNEIDDSELESELMDLMKEDKKPDVPLPPATNQKTFDDLNLIDLEMRLKRLRGDFPELEETTYSRNNKISSQS